MPRKEVPASYGPSEATRTIVLPVAQSGIRSHCAAPLSPRVVKGSESCSWLNKGKQVIDTRILFSLACFETSPASVPRHALDATFFGTR